MKKQKKNKKKRKPENKCEKIQTAPTVFVKKTHFGLNTSIDEFTMQ